MALAMDAKLSVSPALVSIEAAARGLLKRGTLATSHEGTSHTIMTMPLNKRSPWRSTLPARRSKAKTKYPLVLELEPLLQCNLACAGCGKIQHPDEILRQRLSVEECIAAVEECGAPMVSIAGGEPLVHEQMPQIVEELVKRKKFVFLCTNALLLKKKIHLFKPSVYFVWMIHLDGMRERHDQSVCRDGVFDKAIEAIKEAKSRGFRVFTNTTFFDQDGPEVGPRGARLPQRRPQGRHDADLAGVRVREGSRPGALPRASSARAKSSGKSSPAASARSGG